ncbi:MAG: M10 family metallopeptidase C-terminal domain-containing protein [Sedimentitalea sp.]|uniref:Ig-like domain-containing protein n=1 Tax=Sedimentitalea sp. TaxID=2048915 RepID=UPI00326333F5
MPIYIESKGIQFDGNIFARHEYLVYVPPGEELNYAAWTTIGAYPTSLANTGAGSLLNAEFVNDPLSVSKDAWLTSNFDDDLGMTVEELVAAGHGDEAAQDRRRELVFSGSEEGAVWAALQTAANARDDIFIYKTVDIPGGDLFWGPTVNSNSFVTSILRSVSESGYDILAFETALNEPGNQTWIGTANADAMNASTVFAAGDQVHALYGGEGADNLTNASGSHDVVIVAGDDYDRDVVLGGTGDDTIAGYYNQNDLSRSDSLSGGGGDDVFIVVDPSITLAGGIPDLDAARDAAGGDFTHDGTVVGSGGLIDGGDGFDILDYRYITGPVHLLLDGNLIQNVERINLTQFESDYVEVAALQDGLDVLVHGGFFGTNVFSIAESAESIFIAQEFTSTRSYRLEDTGGTGRMVLQNFEVYELTEFDDEASYHLIDESGQDLKNIRLSSYSAEGDDTITGSAAHDDLHGGIGNDTINGGDGADYLYDNGASERFKEGEDFEAYLNRLLAYDTDGDDMIEGGAGSDVFLHSGGTDVFEGGAGHDTYLTIGEVHGTYDQQDNLTIVLSEDAGDSETWFGNDLIIGDGRGVDLVRFEGINSSEVTISYQYEEIFLGSQVVDFDPFFWWTFDFEPQTVDHYQTVGSYEIRVNATGSSIVIENVIGYHTRGDNPSGLVQIEASMAVPFTVQFDDGYMSWPDNVLDGSNANYTFENSELGENAFAARDALQEERAVPETQIDGDETDEELYGYNSSDRFNGGGGDDVIYAGGGDDEIAGGTGGDTMDGGAGTDTASYAGATERVGIRLRDTSFQSGEASGDVLINIENLRGSDFDDYLGGDDQRNFIYGGAGNDRIYGFGGIDEMHGEDGDDELTTSYWHDDRLYGGAGNDELNGSSGDDFLYGGAGDDRLIAGFQVNIYGDLTPGNDLFDGGDGNDTAEFWWSDDIMVDLGAGQAVYQSLGETITLISIENAIGSRANDLLVGSDADNLLVGDGGDDTLVGGVGNDTLVGDTESGYSDNVENNFLYGGVGIDTARISGDSTSAGYAFVEGGIAITTGNTVDTVYDDVEFIQFNDVTLTYAEVAGPLITEFAVIDDFIRVAEAATVTIDLLANDLEYQGNPISLVSIAGQAVTPGLVVRLASGATLTVEADGSLTLDQGGAYAWLDAGASASETLAYTATDASGVIRTGTATLIIDGTDTATDQIHLDRNAYVTETDANNADALRIGNFDVAKTVLIVDEKYIDPNDVPAGVTVEEINGDTFVTYGGDDAVILNDVSLETWQYAAGQQTLGSSSGETINGTDGVDVIQAGAGNDTVNAAAGDDVVVGGDGDDRLEFSDGDNIALGGAGEDRIIGNGYAANLFYGGADDDTLYGAELGDTLHGGSGDDVLFGREGDDMLYGGAGDDDFYGGDGIDFFDGGDGFDRLELQNEYPTSYSPGLIVDMAKGYFGWKDNSYGIERFENIEYVVGGNGDDLMLGNDQDNRLDGVSGDDISYGGAGNDTLTDGYGNNEFYGEAGDDYIYSSSTGDDLYDGGDGDDILVTRGGQDTFLGGAGSDTVRIGFSMAATVFDFVNEEMRFAGLTLTMQGIENAEGGRNNDTFLGDGAANSFLGDDGNDLLQGNGGNDILNGEDGDDTHEGGAGDDILIGNLGLDSFDGGDGVDTLDFSYLTQDATYDLGAGTVTFSAGGSETAINLENVIGGTGRDQITGTLADNMLDGRAGDDVYTTGAGHDLVRIASGTGADVVTDFDIHADQVEIDGVIIEPNQTYAGVTISQTGADLLIAFGSGDSLTLTGVDLAEWRAVGPDGIVTGTSGDDVINTSFVDAGGDSINDSGQIIEGLAGDDRFYDGAGDDTVSGGAGRDRFYAGEGADSYDGGSNNLDEVYFTRSSVGLTVDLSDTGNNTGIAAGDSYSGIERLQGSNHDDVLVSGGATVTLNGRSGDDDFTDDAGRDNFRGGDGADTYRFVAGDGAQDRVFDFQIGADHIDLSAWGVTDFNDLTITEATNSSGSLLGRLVVRFGSESIRLDGLETADIPNLDATHFTVAPDSGDGVVSGTDGNDTIKGSYFDADGDYINGQGQLIQGLDGDDRIYDGAGNDTVEGGAGRDRFFAGDGADSYDGGDSSNDEVFYYLSSSGLTVDASDTVNSTGIAAGDSYVSVERLQGSNFDDILITGGSVRVLNGRAGDDQFTDDRGKDLFDGGSGADTFRFISGDGQQDRILDFELGIDLIDISDWGATAVADLTFSERLNGSGTPQGDLTIDYGSESLRVDGFNAAQIASFDENQFVFA